MSKAIVGAAEIGGAVGIGGLDMLMASTGVGTAAMPVLDKAMFALASAGIATEAGAIADALVANRGMGITVRQPASYRQIIYGEQRVGGIIVYQSTTGSHHDQYNFVIVLATHPCEAIVNLYLDGRQVFWQNQGTSGSRANGDGTYFGGQADGNDHYGPSGQKYNFGGLVYCEMRLGEQVSGDVIGGLTANDPVWTGTSQGNPYVGGCTYVYLKIEYDQGNFPQLPEIRFTVKGKNTIYDPRTGATGYSTNAALIVADALTDPTWGVGDNTVNQAQLIAAANICDQQVTLAAGGTETQFPCHYHYDTSVSPGNVLETLLKSCAGRLSRIGGEWYIFPGAWLGPSFLIDEAMFVGPVQWTPKRSLPELCNRVTGTYIAPNYPYNVAGDLYDSNGYYNGAMQNNFPFAFQPTNYPEYACDTLHGYADDIYLTADGDVYLSYELGLPCVLSIAQAQRLAKIHMMRNRQQGVAVLQLGIAAMQLQPCDVILVTYQTENWVNKYFEVVEWKLMQGKDHDGNPYPYVEVTLNETDPSVYEWNPQEELSPYDVPIITGGIPWLVDAPTNVTIEDDASTMLTLSDGSSMPRLLVSWIPPQDTYVNNGGTIEVQYMFQTAAGAAQPSVGSPEYVPAGGWWNSQWIDAGSTSGQSTSKFIDGITTNEYQSIIVRVRAVRAGGGVSQWVACDAYMMLTSPPTWNIGAPNGPVITFANTGTTLADLEPAEAGADVTGQHTAWDTSNVNGVEASSVSQGATGININLIPDSDFKFGDTYWPISSCFWWGSSGTGNFLGFAADSAQNTHRSMCKATIPVGAGQQYTLSAFINSEALSAGFLYFGLADQSGNVVIELDGNSGSSGRISQSFSVPNGVTTLTPYYGAWANAIGNGWMRQPQLQCGSAVTAYIANLVDQSTGYFRAGSSQIDLASDIHLNKTLDYLDDGETYQRPLYVNNGVYDTSRCISRQGSIACVSEGGDGSICSAMCNNSQITVSWEAFAIYSPDGTTYNIPANPSGQTFSGLASNTTYYFAAWFTVATQLVTIALIGTSGASMQYQVQVVQGDGNIGIAINFTYETTASASWNSGGRPKPPGGGSQCFSPETLVLVRTPAGDIHKPIVDVERGDLALTLRGTWRPVLYVSATRYVDDMVLIPGVGKSTPTHQMWDGTAWIDAQEIYPERIAYDGWMHNLHIDTESEDEHSYTLANGQIVHNFYTIDNP